MESLKMVLMVLSFHPVGWVFSDFFKENTTVLMKVFFFCW